MPTFNVNKSIEIEAPVEKVFGIINNFHHWRPWSPWLIMDPNVKLDITKDGKFYSWAGDLTGDGEMTVLSEVENQSVDYDLTFLKPWKSKAKVRFEVQAAGNQTKVNWLLESKLPFFMFFLKNMMTAMIGMDFERGLAMLKDYAESGEVPSKLEFKGASQFPGCTYVGIRTACTTKEVGPKMSADLGKLFAFFQDKEALREGVPFSIYHKYDMVKGRTEYTTGMAVKEIPADLPEGFITGTIPATKIYTMNHIGTYRHLGNAWSTLYSMQRQKKFKSVKNIPPFETYVSDPRDVAPKDIVTAIHFAIQ